MSSKQDQVFDKRVLGRNIKHNRISRKEYEQYLKALPDVTAKAVPIFFDDGSGGASEESTGGQEGERE